MELTVLLCVTMLLVVGTVSGQADVPYMAIQGKDVIISGSSITLQQQDGQSVSSTDLLQMQSDLASALTAIQGLTTLTDKLTQKIATMESKANATTDTVSTVVSIQNMMKTQILSVQSGVDSANRNLVDSSDFSDTSTWRWGTFQTERVAWDANTFITANKVSETTHDIDQSTCYGRFAETNFIKVDPKQNYQFGLWLKTSGADMRNYFGYTVFDENKKVITGDWKNPYFNAAIMAVGKRWTYLSAVLRASDSPVDISHTTSETSAQTDWKLPSNATYVTARWGSCYGNGDGEGDTWFAFPEVKRYFPDKNVNDDAEGDAKSGTNLIVGSDFSNVDSWVYPNNIGLSRTNWNDGSPVTASMFVETNHDNGDKICYGKDGNVGGNKFAETNYFEVDVKKKYDISIWIKSNDSTLNNYFGFNVYDKDLNQIKGEFQYAYFRSNQNDSNHFVYQNAAMWPTDTRGPTKRVHPDTTSNIDFKFPSNAKYMTLRWGACYGDGNGNGASWFMYPQVQPFFGDKLEGYGLMTSPTATNLIGRWDVPVITDFSKKLGESGTNPSPWVPVMKGTNGNGGVGIGFSWGDYNRSVSLDGTQELVYRVCISYTDTGTGGSVGNKFQLRRIVNNNPNYGSAAPYEAGHVFWEENFDRTWSGLLLYRHDCGQWLRADSMNCGYSWADTCEIRVQSSLGGIVVAINNIDLEVGVRRRA